MPKLTKSKGGTGTYPKTCQRPQISWLPLTMPVGVEPTGGTIGSNE
jgi:hypothetical protein